MKTLYAGEDFGVELDNAVYALDSTVIDLCLALFPWARFCKTKAAVKLHTFLDLRGIIRKNADQNSVNRCKLFRGSRIRP